MMKIAIRLLAFSAIFFYTLCWFSHQPTKLLWYIGVGLPWLSLIVSIPLSMLQKSEKDNVGLYWAYIYTVMTAGYVVILSLTGNPIYYQLPHLTTCICFISYFALERKAKK